MGTMRLQARLLVLLLSGAIAGCASSTATGRTKAQAPWREFVSPHFVLHTDIDRSVARATLAELERSFDVFRRIAFASTRPVAGRSEVVLLRRRGDYALVAPGIITAHATVEPHDVLERPLLLITGEFDPVARQVVQHELVHRFVRHELFDVPRWFNEGLASFLSTMTYDEEEVYLGTPPAPPPGLEKRPEVPPLAQLLREPAGFFDLQTGLAYRFGAWGFVHLLATGTQEQRRRLVRYANALGQGAHRSAAWQSGFGDLRLDELEPEYRRHTEFVMPRIVRLPFYMRSPKRPERERVLPVAEVHLLWARLLPWDRTTFARVEAELRAAAGADAAELHYWWGLFHGAQGHREEAEKELRGAVALRPSEERFTLALAQVLTAAESAGQKREPPASNAATEEALAQLGRVAESAVALDFLARQQVARGETERARELALRAVVRDAGCWQCLDTLGQIEFARGAVPEAVQLVERAAGLMPDDAVRPDLLQRLTEYRQAAATPNAAPNAP
jgi:tetratricopeptide (TPR) repeat protein